MTGSARFALFGGSFDPVHVGHVAMARAVLEGNYAQTVAVIPARISPHKLDQADDPLRASAEHRLAMLRRAFADITGVEISTIELERPGPSYTWQTIEAWEQRYPGAGLRLMLGWDQFVMLPQWARFENWAPRVEFLVFSRPSTGDLPPPVEGWPEVRAIFVPSTVPGVASSEIRSRLATGQSVEGMVPSAVLEYIREHHLYSAPK